MKKIIILLCAMLGSVHISFAQPETEIGRVVQKKKPATKVPKFSFGVQAGGSLTNFYSQEFASVLKSSAQGNNRTLSDFTQRALFRPAAGLSLTFNFNRNIAFQPEFLLAVMAQENSYQLAFVSGGQTTNIQSIKSLTEINYLQIPLLFQFSFGKSLIRPYLKLGGTPAYILKSTRKDETATASTTGGTTTNTTSSAEQDLVAQSNVDRFQGGATVAAGLHLGRFIDLESRYDFTLTSLNNDVNSFYKGAKSQALGVQLGVRF